MFNLLHLSDRVEPPVRVTQRKAAPPTQFRLLVRHLLQRFFNNETVSAGGEPLALIMTTACAIAMPTFVFTLLLFPAYHAYPPGPPVPPFWEQAGQHYFFVLYSLVAMGAITLFEADLLFPGLLDILILSTLPIPVRRLRLARVWAVVVFLVLFLFGVNLLGVVAFPLMTDNPLLHLMNVPALLWAHFVAVTLAGAFAAAVFVGLQGLLICTLGAGLYRIASTLLQGGAVAALLTMLLSYLAVFHRLQDVIRSSSVLVMCFPPLWFLGVYESVLGRGQALPAFRHLAYIGYGATAVAVMLAMATYPLAYRRRTRQVTEGSAATHGGRRGTGLNRLLKTLLHRTLLRVPGRRAVFYFIGQTLRTERHRVYLAMYSGLGLALIAVCSLEMHVGPHRVGFRVSPDGLRLAIPGLAFWAIAGLCTALDSAADSAASWVFRAIDGKPTLDQLDAVRLWVTLWGTLCTLIVLVLLQAAVPADLRSWREGMGQGVLGAGLCLVLSDGFLFRLKAIPFTETRIPHNTDLAFVLLRYLVLFPAIVLGAVRVEPWIERSTVHLFLTAFLFAAVHQAMRYAFQRTLTRERSETETDEVDGFMHSFGLRES